MLHHYTFDTASLTCGQRKSESVIVNLAVDTEDDDPYADPKPKGHYQNGFACQGQLTFEWPTSVPTYFKKMLEGTLVVRDEGETSSLKIVLLDMLHSQPCLPGALPNQPCRTKKYTWSFLCCQKPSSDGLGLFPEVVKRKVMKVFIFSRFPGFWNDTQTSAVVTAFTRHQAIELLNEEMKQKGLAALQEGGYSLVELDPTRSAAHVVHDGS